MKNSHRTWLFICLFIVIILLLGAAFSRQNEQIDSLQSDEMNISPTNALLSPTQTALPTITREETQQIESWIKNNNLNDYGDPSDSVYLGGTPLFNEETGTTIDRFDYIRTKHPDSPWKR